MTKMAAMPIYGKNHLKIFFSRTRRPMTLGLGCSIGDVGPTKFVQMMILGWPWPTELQGQICFLMHLNGKISEKLMFLKTVEALVITLTWYV